MRHIWLVLLITFFLAAPCLAGSSRPSGAPAVKEGAAAPDFTLSTTEGEEVSLSDLRGKIVFLNFWATWCPPCRAEMPSMERLNEVFGGEEFTILAVNTENDPEAVKRWLAKTPYTFPVLLDSQGVVQNLYRVFQFPETFIIDRDGQVINHFIGAHDYSSTEFLKYIETLTAR